MKNVTTFFAACFLLVPLSVSAATPTILDSLNITHHTIQNGQTGNFTYTVPSTGANHVLIAELACNTLTGLPTATQNGTSLGTFVHVSGTVQRAAYYISYLAAPTTGTFSLNLGETGYCNYWVFTVQDGAQTSPIDVSGVTSNANTTSLSTSVTTTVGNDLLIGMGANSNAGTISYGANQTETVNENTTTTDIPQDMWGGSQKAAGSSGGSESMSTTYSASGGMDMMVFAIKYQASASATPTNNDSASWFSLF